MTGTCIVASISHFIPLILLLLSFTTTTNTVSAFSQQLALSTTCFERGAIFFPSILTPIHGKTNTNTIKYDNKQYVPPLLAARNMARTGNTETTSLLRTENEFSSNKVNGLTTSSSSDKKYFPFFQLLRRNWPILSCSWSSRSHEPILCGLYLTIGIWGMNQLSTIATVWMSFCLAISCTEAWVKFRAPFLKKHVAVDVGRHVFAALLSVETGLAGSFWIKYWLQTHQHQQRLGLLTNIGGISAVVATMLYVTMFLVVGPMLFVRAKYQIVQAAAAGSGQQQDSETGSRSRSSSSSSSMDPSQLIPNSDTHKIIVQFEKELQDYNGIIPSPKWHIVYIIMELIKISCLTIVVAREM